MNNYNLVWLDDIAYKDKLMRLLISAFNIFDYESIMKYLVLPKSITYLRISNYGSVSESLLGIDFEEYFLGGGTTVRYTVTTSLEIELKVEFTNDFYLFKESLDFPGDTDINRLFEILYSAEFRLDAHHVIEYDWIRPRFHVDIHVNGDGDWDTGIFDYKNLSIINLSFVKSQLYPTMY